MYLPFYWDEAWVYGKAARIMAEEGISLLPNSLHFELGRGHPLLFHATFGLFLKIFGNTIFNAHLLALIISFFTLLTVFRFSEKFFGKWSGVFAVAILLPQPIFLAQSNLVLPEMALALFVILSVKFFLEKKMIWYFVAASVAILIKESAIVLFGAISLGVLYDGIQRQKKLKQIFYEIVIVNIPLLWWGLHLLIHKIQMGNFFFHEHTGYISFKPTEITDKLNRAFYFVFLAQGRNIFSLVLLTGMFYSLIKRHPEKNSELRKLLWLFMLVFFVFTSINYFSDRYLLVAVLVFVVLVTRSVWKAFAKTFIRISFAALCIGAGIFSLYTYSSNSDHNIGYTNAVKVYKEAINYLKQNHNKSDTIYAYFNMKEGIESHIPGYTNEDKYFINLKAHPEESCRYFIFSNVENAHEQKELEEKYDLKTVKRFEMGVAWVEIMKKP